MLKLPKGVAVKTPIDPTYERDRGQSNSERRPKVVANCREARKTVAQDFHEMHERRPALSSPHDFLPFYLPIILPLIP
jgi:hypothetical protein